MSSSRDFFNQAEACIENEEIAKAKDLIEQAIALGPTDDDILYRAVNWLIYAELYSSARRAVEHYRERTGQKLAFDLTYEEIVQLEQANLIVDDVPVFDLAAGPLRFVRLSDQQRGSLTSYVTTSMPVEEIEVSEEGITITQSRIKHHYAWNEITRASIVARIIFKGMGYVGGKASQKICTLEAPESKRFQFDVSPTYPDFREALLLRTILNKYLNMEFIDERKPDFKAAKDDPIRNLKRNYWIRELIIAKGMFLFLYLYLHVLAQN
jgi:hypothetical protein